MPSSTSAIPRSPDHACTSAAVAGPKAVRWRRTSASGSSAASGAPSQSSADVNGASDGNDQRSSLGTHRERQVHARRVAERALIDAGERVDQQRAQLVERARLLREQPSRDGEQRLDVERRVAPAQR